MHRLGRTLSAFLVRALAVALLLTIAFVVALSSASSALPDLGTPAAIEALLRQEVEGARAVQATRTLQLAAPFVLDDELFLSPAGKALLAAEGCAEQGVGAPESQNAFRWRLLARWLRRPPEEGSGKCELQLAEGLVRMMGLEGSRGQRLLAAARVRETLPHHLLLADWGSAYPFTPTGPFGLDEASQRLFGKPAAKLDWNEAAMLALSTDFFEEVETCRHPPKLQSLRDPFLLRLAALYPAEAKEILAAKGAAMACERPPPPLGFAR